MGVNMRNIFKDREPVHIDGQMALDDALERVDEHADDNWKWFAELVVRRLASAQPTFTTDDVWMELESFDVSTHEPRALGAIMRNLAREGLIRTTDRYVKSDRPECHQRPIPVWATC